MGSGALGMVTRLPSKTKLADKVNSVPKVNKDAVFDIPFSVEYAYQNGLSFDVNIIFRNGMAFTIPKTNIKWRPCNDFTIFVKYKFRNSVKIDVHHLLDVVDDKSVYKQIRTAFQNANNNVVVNGNEAIVAYHVSVESFRESNGSLYIEDLDITLTYDESGNIARTVHPYSREGVHMRNQQEKAAGYNYRIVINDPDNIHGHRFINIRGLVFKVKAAVDYGKESGVYFTYTDEEDKDVEQYFSFEEADEALMMYKTASDAKVFGNILESRKREIEEKQHEQRLQILSLESENARLKVESERTIASIKEERARQDAAYNKLLSEHKERELVFQAELRKLEAKYAEEKAHRDDYLNKLKLKYETASLDRKDTSEFIKWLPVIITGGLLAFKALL